MHLRFSITDYGFSGSVGPVLIPRKNLPDNSTPSDDLTHPAPAYEAHGVWAGDGSSDLRIFSELITLAEVNSLSELGCMPDNFRRKFVMPVHF